MVRSAGAARLRYADSAAYRTSAMSVLTPATMSCLAFVQREIQGAARLPLQQRPRNRKSLPTQGSHAPQSWSPPENVADQDAHPGAHAGQHDSLLYPSVALALHA